MKNTLCTNTSILIFCYRLACISLRKANLDAVQIKVNHCARCVSANRRLWVCLGLISTSDIQRRMYGLNASSALQAIKLQDAIDQC